MNSRVTTPHTIAAAERGLAVLRSVYRSGQGKQLAVISTETGLDKAGVLRILSTLVAEGIIRREVTTGAYHPDMRSWIYLASSIQPGLAFVKAVQEILDAAAGATGATAGLVLPISDSRSGMAALWSAAKTAVHYDPSRAPQITPLHTSAAGKCLLAAFPPAQLRTYLQHPLEHLTDRTITSPAKLRRALALVRKQSYAMHVGELTPGVSGIAVPLQSLNGAPPGAVTFAVPHYDTPHLVRTLLSPLREAAQQISHLFGPVAWLDFVRASDQGGSPVSSPWEAPDLDFEDSPVLYVRSVSRMIRLMSTALREPQGVSLRDLARRRRLDKTTVWRLLNTLVVGDVLWQDLPDQKFRISPRFWLRHATILGVSASLTYLVSGLLEHVAAESGATALLALPDREMRNSVIYQWALPHTPMCFHPEYAPVAPLHTTATGKAYLAVQSPLTVQRYLDAGLPALTAHSITTREELLEELAQVRRVGFALNREEMAEGIGACAVPVTDASGTVVGSLAVVSTLLLGTPQEGFRLLPLLQETAQALSPLLVGEWQGRLKR